MTDKDLGSAPPAERVTPLSKPKVVLSNERSWWEAPYGMEEIMLFHTAAEVIAAYKEGLLSLEEARALLGAKTAQTFETKK